MVVLRALRGRRLFWLAGLLLVVVGAPFLLWGRAVLRPLGTLTRSALSPVLPAPPAATPPPVALDTVQRQVQGLSGLLAEAEAGTLFPDAPDRVLVTVDQGLVQRLLTALTPSDHVVADRYHVVVTGARVLFEDGFALVRLDGRASLSGVAESDVFADLAVVGGLELPSEQEKPEVLNARIHVLGVEARQVSVGGRSRSAEELVEELGRTKLEDFASLASSLEIPVRQQYQITIPAVGPGGPVRIAAATLPLRLALRSVRAFHGKLWITMGASVGDAAAPPSSPGPPAAATPGPDLRGLSPDEQLLRLGQEHRRLRERFESLIAKEALVKQTERVGGDLVASVRASLVKQVAQETIRHYFDRVTLDLSGIEVTESGKVGADTFLGRVNAGEWTVDLNLHHVRGLLRARAPQIELEAGEQVDLHVPVMLEEGQGTAAIRFAWEASGLAKIVCKSFQTRQEISGRVKPEEYPVSGRFLLAAVNDSLAATPRFDPAFRVKVELTPESWAKVRSALESQDDITRCGIALDPDKLFAQLQERVGKGFVIHLPRKLLRTVTLPPAVAPAVNVEGRRVGVTVTRNALRITPDGLWYGVGIRADISGAPRPGAIAAPPP
ncbi:MAG: hypothetical protein DMF82_04730 [Acidobacteria bacterium]|nr:MAG: hypothetical protein DMF82_04730 [Acidobacteriota bacterium]